MHSPAATRIVATTTALAVAGVVLAGCGSVAPDGSAGSGMKSGVPSSTLSTSSTPSSDPSSESTVVRSDRPSAGGGPSSAAKLICGQEVAAAVKRNFDLASRPTGIPHWSKATRSYTCRYSLRSSVLVLSVKDLTDLTRGRAYFQRLQSSLGAVRIKGLEALGFPAFQNHDGQVGFLKDGKTLYVDDSRVARSDLPQGLDRTIVAYGVAASIIGCWTE